MDLTPPVNISASPPCATPPTSPCFTVNSPTSITIGYMPAGTGQVNITVTTQGGTSPATSSNIYTYNPAAPAVTKPLLPKFGSTAGDEAISLFGSGFGQAGQDFVSDVYFGSVDVPSSNAYPCPTSSAGCFIVVGPGQLAIYTPANSAGTVDVEVMTTLGRSLAVAVDKYTFVPPAHAGGLLPTERVTRGLRVVESCRTSAIRRPITRWASTVLSLRRSRRRVARCRPARRRSSST